MFITFSIVVLEMFFMIVTIFILAIVVIIFDDFYVFNLFFPCLTLSSLIVWPTYDAVFTNKLEDTQLTSHIPKVKKNT